MKTLSKFLSNAFVKLADPEREERIQELVRALKRGLQAKRDKFDVDVDLQDLAYSDADLEFAGMKVYRDALEKLWQDGKLTSAERAMTGWIVRCLRIPKDSAARVNLEFAHERFAAALAHAMTDGRLDAAEVEKLEEIAASVGSNMAHFARTFFEFEGESFLRGVFLSAVEDGQITPSEWKQFLQTSEYLGIPEAELLETIRPQAEQFAVHALADAKADNKLSQTEEAMLRWLVSNLGLSQQFNSYIESEISNLRTLTEIAIGKLPTRKPPAGVEIRSGEIVHYHGRATRRDLKVRKSGVHDEDHEGHLTLTDNRIIFSSPTKSQNFSYRKVIGHRGGCGKFEVQTDGKPVITFYMDSPCPIVYPILETAIAFANQTKVSKSEGKTDRHIPRDVRQRVWQRYGGRCAECSATEYLEFDHVIPVARGGNNLDNNIQLLCRRCNLLKSDNI